MKHVFFGLFLFSYSLLCSAQTDSTQTSINTIVNGNNAFGFDLFLKTQTAAHNGIFSPASITAALAITMGGTAGETRKQLADALHFSTISNNVHSGFKSLLPYYNTQLPGKQLQLHLLNALWLRAGAKFQETYINLTKSNYGTVLFPLTTAAVINNWAAKETKNRIKNVLNEKELAGAALVISNVVYFKGAWKERFDTLHTKVSNFKLADATLVKVPFMNKTINTRYFENETMQALELAYRNDNISMIILLPKISGSLPEFVQTFSLTEWNGVNDSLEDRKVKVSLPKFKFTTTLDLQQPLTALGVVNAFKPSSADFSPMSTDKMYISKIVHKAFIEVNEQGTEAAAATHVGVGYTSVATVPVFNANKPFVFLIKENKYNSILFMGQVANPKQ